MKVEVNMIPEDAFYSASWWGKSPDIVLETLRKQLEAATAVWPDLGQYKIEKKRLRDKSKGAL